MEISKSELLNIIGELEDSQGQEWLEETRTQIQIGIDKLEAILKQNDFSLEVKN